MVFDWVLKQPEAISVPPTHTHSDKSRGEGDKTYENINIDLKPTDTCHD